MKNQIAKTICLASISLTIAACSTYPLDPNGPHAQITVKDYHFFSNANNYSVLLNNQTCENPTGNLALSGNVSINAEKPITLIVVHTIGYNQLLYPITFTPQKNHFYSIVTNKFDAPNNGIRVELQLMDQINNMKSGKLTPFIKRDFKSYLLSAKCTDTNYATKPKVTSWNQTAKYTPLVIVY